MSSHHPVQPQQLQLGGSEAGPQVLTASPNGAADGLAARFHDQQTGQVVEATPVTVQSAGVYAAQQRRTRGAVALAGPAPTAGDWVITQGNGAAPRQADVVIGPDFLRRFFPADERARALLKSLGVTAGGAGAGAPGVATARVTDVLTTGS
jgi:hypothetical protein